MMEIIKSETFERWLTSLRDRMTRLRIQARIDRLAEGNPGDVKPIGDGLSEMRIHAGPGYRVYFMQRGSVRIILLAGGDKGTQEADIRRALEISKEWRD